MFCAEAIFRWLACQCLQSRHSRAVPDSRPGLLTFLEVGQQLAAPGDLL